MKAAFALTARNKEKYVARAVQGALEQTYPCHILLSDQHSDDRTFEVMEETVANFKMPMRKVPKPAPDPLVPDVEYEEVPLHKVDLLHCPIVGAYCMRSANDHFLWLSQQTDAEWIFQCSADDYSLPDRVKVCMFEQEAKKLTADAIANTMWFANPDGTMYGRSDIPGGYIGAGQGISKLAFGSCIHAFHRDFIAKVGSAGDVTMDVYYGYLAALGRGFYIVNDPQHVHGRHADVNNMGFEGKMRGAEAAGDTALLAQLNELNHFQLFELYYHCALGQQKLYPLAHEQDRMQPVHQMLGQAVAWYNRRKELHQKGIAPKVLS